MDMNAADVWAELPELVRPLRRAEFEALAASGMFDEERVELLFGALVAMSPVDPAHDQSVNRLARLLMRQLGERAEVRVQSAFAASDDCEPLPDVVVAPAGEYWTAHPRRALLVVEVSNSSLRKDRGVKRLLYGHASVDEYWVVDLAGRQVEVYRSPTADGWTSRTIVGCGASLTLRGFPEVAIPVAAIVPPG